MKFNASSGVSTISLSIKRDQNSFTSWNARLLFSTDVYWLINSDTFSLASSTAPRLNTTVFDSCGSRVIPTCKAPIASVNLPNLPVSMLSIIAWGLSSLRKKPINDSLSQSNDLSGSLTDINAVYGQSILLYLPLSSGKPHKHLRAYTVLLSLSTDVSMNNL